MNLQYYTPVGDHFPPYPSAFHLSIFIVPFSLRFLCISNAFHSRCGSIDALVKQLHFFPSIVNIP